MTTSNLVSRLRQDFINQADEKTKNSAQRFFKEPVTVHGVKFGAVSKISSLHFKAAAQLPKAQFYSMVAELFKSGYLEEQCLAGSWVAKYGQFESHDLKLFKKWILKYIDNWAACDTFCNHAVGDFIQQYPSYLVELKSWAKSENRWLRRAAAVSLIVPAKKGLWLADILEIADILLTDSDDMVQKGYGWMLKEASRNHQSAVFNYVIKNKASMPRTALRYAIEKMPQQLRKQAMEK